MKLIVGLGNPGKKYERTRHNLGFAVVEGLVQKWNVSPHAKKKFSSRLFFQRQKELILVQPQTMMNASGFAVKKIVDFYQIEPAEVWVIHDDLDLPLGKIRIRRGGGTAGHRGIDSIVAQLGTADFVRFRLGIGRPLRGGKQLAVETPDKKEVDDYVLAPFKATEKKLARKMIDQAVEAVNLALKENLKAAMTRFNP